MECYFSVVLMYISLMTNVLPSCHVVLAHSYIFFKEVSVQDHHSCLSRIVYTFAVELYVYFVSSAYFILIKYMIL